MSELQDMLRGQARLHRKQGAVALGQLFESAIEEIQLLKKTYNQLFDAFQDCQGELAKANERVKELSELCASHEKDMFRQCVFMEKVAEKLEQHREWQATAKVLRRPTRESQQALNKFAIEKKIEGAYSVISLLDPTKDSKAILMANKYIREQLHKEQEQA